MVADLLPDNSERRTKQKSLDIRVIVGNPPYSAQQANENEANQNVVYPNLDTRIRGSYAKRSASKLAKNAYDSYVRAIRWASDRIGKNGVVAYVTNGSFIEAKNLDGLRKCLVDEASDLFVFD